MARHRAVDVGRNQPQGLPHHTSDCLGSRAVLHHHCPLGGHPLRIRQPQDPLPIGREAHFGYGHPNRISRHRKSSATAQPDPRAPLALDSGSHHVGYACLCLIRSLAGPARSHRYQYARPPDSPVRKFHLPSRDRHPGAGHAQPLDLWGSYQRFH